MEQMPGKRPEKKASAPEPFETGTRPLNDKERGTRTIGDALADADKIIAEKARERRYENIRRTEGLSRAEEQEGQDR